MISKQRKLGDSNEFELLRYCARTEIPPPLSKKIIELVASGLDWKKVLLQADFHRVTPMLYKSITEICPEDIPLDINASLHESARATSVLGHFMVKELGRVIQTLESAGIPVISLKGPTLAQYAYGDIGLRLSVDLDILIDPENFTLAKRALSNDGYEAQGKFANRTGLREQMLLWSSRQIPLQRGQSVFNVDLHTNIMPPVYYFNILLSSLIDRSVLIDVAGTAIRSCEANDLLLILCLHGTKNRWERLKYICDLAELIRSASDLDWDIVIRRAKATRCEKMLYLGLNLASCVLDAQVPTEFTQSFNKINGNRKWTKRLSSRLPHQVYTGTAGFLDRFKFHLVVQDDFRTASQYLLFSLLSKIKTSFSVLF